MKPRQNPFRADCVCALPFVAGEKNAEKLWEKLENQNGRGAIIGPCGTGKTTFLDGFERELQRRDFTVSRLDFSSENRVLPADLPRATNSQSAILVDGWEQLSWRDAWKLRRACAPFRVVVATSHRPIWLPIWFQTRTSPQLLESLCADLGAPISADFAEKLWQKHRGNLRLALRELYDLAANDSNATQISP